MGYVSQCIEHSQMHFVAPGTKLVAIGTRNVPELEFGAVYTANRVEEGIFTSRPFVEVEGRYGPYMCHLSRFEFAEAPDV
ncbi:hypothetical protein HOR19_gp08 [Phage MedPE-SWcel-C56]|uniref:Uncharacterized protein n=1 Tax=Phage MedPE-SWcel-C56 TaxID=1871314 RepID=A0A1B1IY00_9CAUD|nr:hypothetical protein HOR19_gp08 [Phage MedPE-SWcel-C56]ANS06201.1 hypothetical protein [Phage MedPE-SWcel-C56]